MVEREALVALPSGHVLRVDYAGHDQSIPRDAYTTFADVLPDVPGLEKLTLHEHTQILEGIASGNPETAARHMADHLNRANELYRTAHIQAGG